MFYPDLLLQNIVTMGVGGFLIRLLIVAAVAFFGTRILSGVYVKSFSSAMILALVLALLNATIGWLLSVLAVPLDFLSFGLFSGLIALVINAIVIKIADGILGDFSVKNFWWALGLALLIGFVTSLFNLQFGVTM